MTAQPEATLQRLAAAEATLVSLLHLSGKSTGGLTTTPPASPAELMEINKSFVDALNTVHAEITAAIVAVARAKASR